MCAGCERETRVKPVSPALVTRETCVKRQSCLLRRQPRPHRRNLAPPQPRPATTPPRNPVASPANPAPASFVGMNLT